MKIRGPTQFHSDGVQNIAMKIDHQAGGPATGYN